MPIHLKHKTTQGCIIVMDIKDSSMVPLTPEEVAECNLAQRVEMEQHINGGKVDLDTDTRRKACAKWIEEHGEAWRKAWEERRAEKS